MKKLNSPYKEVIYSFILLFYIVLVYLFSSIYWAGFILLILLPVFIRKSKILLAFLATGLSIYLVLYGKLMNRCLSVSAAEKGVDITAIELCKTYHLYVSDHLVHGGSSFFISGIYGLLAISFSMALAIFILYETDPKRG